MSRNHFLPPAYRKLEGKGKRREKERRKKRGKSLLQRPCGSSQAGSARSEVCEIELYRTATCPDSVGRYDARGSFPETLTLFHCLFRFPLLLFLSSAPVTNQTTWMPSSPAISVAVLLSLGSLGSASATEVRRYDLISKCWVPDSLSFAFPLRSSSGRPW